MAKFFWLRLKDDFFSSLRIKKLRKLAGGDTYVIIYLKLQLKSIQDSGRLFFRGLEKSFAEEMALDIDEDPDNVQITINYLMSCGLMEEAGEDEYSLPYTEECIGRFNQDESKRAATRERVRQHRERKKLESKAESVTVTPCNNNVTPCNGYSSVTCNGEIEIEKDIKIDIDKDEGVERYQSVKDALQEFDKMRRMLKKPMTDLAVKRMLKKLNSLTNDPDRAVAIITQSIDHCWIDLYDLKDQRPLRSQKQGDIAHFTGERHTDYDAILRGEMI